MPVQSTENKKTRTFDDVQDIAYATLMSAVITTLMFIPGMAVIMLIPEKYGLYFYHEDENGETASITTDGIAFAAFCLAVLFFLSLSYVRASQRNGEVYKNNPPCISLITIAGIITGAAVGLFSAKNSEVGSKTITRAHGSFEDYSITLEGGGIIFGLMVLGAALGYLLNEARKSSMVKDFGSAILLYFNRDEAKYRQNEEKLKKQLNPTDDLSNTPTNMWDMKV